MPEKYRQPRWWMLYLALPLAGLLFWLIQRAHVSGSRQELLDLAALLIVAAYLEIWNLTNTVALLHHPRAGGDGKPLYYIRQAAAGDALERKVAGRPLPVVGHYYSDLFTLPMCAADTPPDSPPSSAPDRKESELVSGRATVQS